MSDKVKNISGEKCTIGDLAYFGGLPLFEDALHVGRPNIGDRDKLMVRINDILDRRMLSNSGPYEIEFEERIADYIGVDHCVAMSNGTVALEIAVRGLGLTGEVIVPSFTFIATAHCLQWQEITPVFCDIKAHDYTIDPAAIERLITPKTSGIIGVHLWGRPCDVDALQTIAQRHNLKLVFDAAHAFGCTYQGTRIGGFGDAEVFSFHATKTMNSFEGGAVTTRDAELAKKMRLMKNFGFEGYDRVTYIGTNGKMSEIAAAMGITSFESLPEFIEVNRDRFELYSQELAQRDDIRVIPYSAQETSSYPYVVLELMGEHAVSLRDIVVKLLHAEKVVARRYFYPGCHNMEPYRSYFPNAHMMLPVTEDVMRRVICLPTGTTVSREAVSRVCQVISLILDNKKTLLAEFDQESTSQHGA